MEPERDKEKLKVQRMRKRQGRERISKHNGKEETGGTKHLEAGNDSGDAHCGLGWARRCRSNI